MNVYNNLLPITVISFYRVITGLLVYGRYLCYIFSNIGDLDEDFLSIGISYYYIYEFLVNLYEYSRDF